MHARKAHLRDLLCQHIDAIESSALHGAGLRELPGDADAGRSISVSLCTSS
jgi:hypothetical protein